MPPLGYFTRGASGNGKDVILDKQRAPYIKQMYEMAADGRSGRHIRQWLLANNVTMRSGKDLPLSTIYAILKNPFYYGEFEHLVGCGNWYQGKHEPIITKELYDKVQEQHVVPQKSKWGSKDFPFKQFLKCASCGSAVVGEEKYKQLKDGSKRKNTYYHCSRQVDSYCKEPFAKEDTIIGELIRICNKLTQVKVIDPGLLNASNKYAKMVGVHRQTIKNDQLQAGYIRYILRDGSDFERARLIRNLEIDIKLSNRTLVSAD